MQLNQSYSKIAASIKATGSKQFADGITNYWYLVTFEDGTIAAFGKQQLLDNSVIGRMFNFSVVGMDQVKSIPRINVNSIVVVQQQPQYQQQNNTFNHNAQYPQNTHQGMQNGFNSIFETQAVPLPHVTPPQSKKPFVQSSDAIANRVFGGYAKDLVAAGKTSNKDIEDFFKIWELCIAKGKELDDHFPIGALDNFYSDMPIFEETPTEVSEAPKAPTKPQKQVKTKGDKRSEMDWND